MILLVNSIFINMSNPLSMGIILIIQTITISITSGIMMPNFWFSYVLILIYLGGMLILFVYMASLASNEKFSFKAHLSTMMMLILIPLMTMSESQMSKDMKMKEHTNLIPPITSTSAMMTTILIIYLLIALIVVVKITKFWQGPLRTNN